MDGHALESATLLGREEFPTVLLQTTGISLEPGHALTLLENGAVFDELEALIDQATHSVNITVFMWMPGEASERMCAALERAGRRGVRVRVAVDAFGSKGYKKVAKRLEDVGGSFRVFRKIWKVPLRAALKRTHRKISVIDGRIGVIGGYGVRDVWLGAGDEPCSWRDSHLKVEGPMVRQLQIGFAEVWLSAGGELLDTSEFPELPAIDGGVRAAFVRSGSQIGLTHARMLLELALRFARKRAWIATAYFVPPSEFRDLLCATSRRGVDVRIIVPGEHTDIRTARMAQRSLYPLMEREGVRIYEYGPSMLHRKVMLVDDDVALLGSINIDTLSLRHMEEGSLIAFDRGFAREIEASFHHDFQRSQAGRQTHRGLLPVARFIHRLVHPRARH